MSGRASAETRRHATRPTASSRRSRPGLAPTPVVAAVSLVALALGLVNVRPTDPPAAGDGPSVVIRVSPDAHGRPVAPGFVGLSLEYPAVTAYAGSDPTALNPVFERLVRSLAPGQDPVLRIGGDSADATWRPTPGVAKPAGVSFTLSDRWLAVAGALGRVLHARLLMGLNLEADQPVLAAAEASVLSGALGRSGPPASGRSAPGGLLAFELGNEPELYGQFAWYRTASGRPVTGRPRGYGFPAFQADFRAFAGRLGDLPLAGPTTGGPGWNRYLQAFLAAEPGIALVTAHRYPLQVCFTPPTSPRYPTVSHLLSREATTGLADSFASAVTVAHRHGLALRVDELNTVSCGADPRVSGSRASALWALEALFELARVGVDGVNLHTFPGAGYELFHFARAAGRWRGWVAPEYYGLLMFAWAAPPGARLLAVSGASDARLRAWATEDRGGVVRVVVVNQSRVAPATVRVTVAGQSRPATVQRLLLSSGQITLGGQRVVAGTLTGRLIGIASTETVTATKDGYRLRLAPESAATMTLGGGPGGRP